MKRVLWITDDERDSELYSDEDISYTFSYKFQYIKGYDLILVDYGFLGGRHKNDEVEKFTYYRLTLHSAIKYCSNGGGCNCRPATLTSRKTNKAIDRQHSITNNYNQKMETKQRKVMNNQYLSISSCTKNIYWLF